MLPYQISLHLYTRSWTSKEIIGDPVVVSNNHNLFAKFDSGALRIIDTMRLMSLV